MPAGKGLEDSSLRFYDAHNHLQDERFAGRQDELIGACVREGVDRMVVNGLGEEDWPRVRALAQRHPQIIPSYGCHPWQVPARTPDWQKTLARFLDEIPGAAIGEIGLDRWKPGLDRTGQEEVFLWQLGLAAKRDLPVSIHCLQAWGRLHDLLRAEPRPGRGFLLHSYGGPAELVAPLAKLGAYFGFPGGFTHEGKARRRDAFRQVPRDRLLIETDAPDQVPPPQQVVHPLLDAGGSPIHHPANLAAIYGFVAAWLHEPIDALTARLEQNFLRLFRS